MAVKRQEYANIPLITANFKKKEKTWHMDL